MDKPIDWRGSSLEDLRDFPVAARRDAGFQLRKLHRDELPDDWRPFQEVGPGTIEIRIECAEGTFRVMYIAKFDEAIYVLHSFAKKSRRTSKSDVSTARARYRAVLAERRVSDDQ